MRWKKTIILNRYLSDCPYIRLVLFNEKDIYIVLNEHNIDIFVRQSLKKPPAMQVDNNRFSLQ